MGKDKEIRKCTIGGQGVLEGVMMRSPIHSGLAVRRATGEIVTKEWDNKKRPGSLAKIPIVRGVVNFVDMMMQGVGTISDAAKMYDEEDVASYEPSRFEKFIAKKTGKNAMDVMMVFAVIVGILLAVGLFFILPTVIAAPIRKLIESNIVGNLIEGGIRIIIFLIYMVLVSFMKEIKRVFRYHGAEHKTIAAFEAGEELTVENVRKHKRLHPRCGTSYLLLVMIISILIFAVVDFAGIAGQSAFVEKYETLLRLVTRLVLLPVVAGISYEFLKLFAAHDNWFCRAMRWPGMQLQRLTTAEPDDSMIECAIVAFELALQEKTPEEMQAMIDSFYRGEKKTEEEPEAEAHDEQA